MTSNPQRFDLCCLTGAWSPRPGYADSPFWFLFLSSLLSLFFLEYFATGMAGVFHNWVFHVFAQIAFLIDCLATGMAEVFHNDKNTAGLATLLRFLVESDTSVGRSTSHYTRRTLLRKILNQIVPQSSYLSTKVLLKVRPLQKTFKSQWALWRRCFDSGLLARVPE